MKVTAFTAPSMHVLGAASPRTEFSHAVKFYQRDEVLYRMLADYLTAGQAAGEPAAFFASETHRRGLIEHLRRNGVEVDQLMSSGQFVLLDAHETLAGFMEGGTPNGPRFHSHVGGLLDELRPHSRAGRVRVYGEMVDILWQQGNSEGTLALEDLWVELGRTRSLSMFRTYAIADSEDETHDFAFPQIRRSHGGDAFEGNSFVGLTAAEQLRQFHRLQRRSHELEGENARRKQLESGLRETLRKRERAEKDLRASQLNMIDFLENAVEGFHRMGPDGTIMAANQAELDLLGYARDEYVGHRIADFLVDPYTAADVLARLKDHETLRDYEARLVCKDRSVKDVLIYANGFFVGDAFDHARCFTRDITERRRLENELRRQNRELSSTVRFSEMFVGIFGHDLRNPLSAITTAASLIIRRTHSDDLARPAKRILNSAGRMGRMIDQLLDFTLIRLGKGIPLDRRPTDLTLISRMAIDELESTGEAPRFRTTVEGDAVGMWDSDRLLQLVSNLVGNALAHGQAQGMVHLRIDGASEAEVTLEVQNFGMVSAAIMPMLFEPLRSADNEKQEGSNGLGLGLFISQQIAYAHAGAIAVFSSEAEGTRMVVTLPRNAAARHPVFHAAEGLS
jgi:PAS domain S-box-containing protein